MIIVKLTSNIGNPIYVNMSQVLFFRSVSTGGTHLEFSGDSVDLNVRETPNEIEQILDEIISQNRPS